MSAILNPPGTVLFADTEDDAPREVVLNGEADEFQVVEDVDVLESSLSGTHSVCCLVLGPTCLTATCREFVETVRAVDGDLPIVFVTEDSEPERLRLALDAGEADVVSRAASDEGLRTAVDEAIDTYRQRRVEREESDMLGAMLDSLDKAIYFKDDQARHIYLANVAGGFDPDEARGKTDIGLYGDEDPESAREAFEDDMRVIENQESVVDREEQVGEDDELWMQTTKVPWTDGDEVKGLIGHTINVTEYKQKEREYEELGRRFETFTSRLGHDVRTPLQVASGYLELAQDTGDPEPIEDARQALERIDQIITDYGTLTTQAAQVDEVSPVNLRDTVEEVWNGLDSQDVDLVLDVGDATYINATEEMVRPVLENLLKNAVTHAGPDVTIRVGTTDDGFYVEDTGKGIPESKREKVLETGYTTGSDGSGRGLSIVLGEMDKHVWSLSIQDSPEGGARFQVDNCLFEDEDDESSEDLSPVELNQQDAVGTLQQPGRAEYEEAFDRWVVAGGGDDIFRGNNNFFYVHAAVDGPVRIQGKVADVEYVDRYSKGGFMVRDSLEADATYGYVGKTPGHGTELLWRSTTGDLGRSRQLEEQAFTFNWYRLDRVGDEVRMYISLDGDRWQQVDRKEVDLSDPVHVGMVTCSGRVGQQCESMFERVSAFKCPGNR